MRQQFVIVFLCALAGPVALAQGALRFGIEVEGWQTEAGVVSADGDSFRSAGYPDDEWHPSLGAILQWKSWFAKVTASSGTDFDGRLTLTQVAPVDDPIADLVRTVSDFTTEMERKDLDISLGYSWSNGFTVFAGYKKIEFTENFFTDQVEFTFFIVDGDGDMIMTNPIAMGVTWNVNSSYDFDGPFVGGSYSYPLGNLPLVLNVSLAYADLSSDFRQSAFGTFDTGEVFQNTNVAQSYDVAGLSWRLGLGYNITDHFSAGIGFKGQKYDEDSGDQFIGQDLDSDGLTLRLRYMF